VISVHGERVLVLIRADYTTYLFLTILPLDYADRYGLINVTLLITIQQWILFQNFCMLYLVFFSSKWVWRFYILLFFTFSLQATINKLALLTAIAWVATLPFVTKWSCIILRQSWFKLCGSLYFSYVYIRHVNSPFKLTSTIANRLAWFMALFHNASSTNSLTSVELSNCWTIWRLEAVSKISILSIDLVSNSIFWAIKVEVEHRISAHNDVLIEETII